MLKHKVFGENNIKCDRYYECPDKKMVDRADRTVIPERYMLTTENANIILKAREIRERLYCKTGEFKNCPIYEIIKDIPADL